MFSLKVFPEHFSFNCAVQWKEPISKIWNRYSQKRNCTATAIISTFMCLWTIYTYPRLICLFCCRKYVDRSWEYINRSQTHECGNLDWGRKIPRKGIQKWDFCCSVLCVISLPMFFKNQYGYKKCKISGSKIVEKVAKMFIWKSYNWKSFAHCNKSHNSFIFLSVTFSYEHYRNFSTGLL